MNIYAYDILEDRRISTSCVISSKFGIGDFKEGVHGFMEYDIPPTYYTLLHNSSISDCVFTCVDK